MGLKIIAGDKAFYYLHEEGKLQGAVLMHVDDFTIAGNADNLHSEHTSNT